MEKHTFYFDENLVRLDVFLSEKLNFTRSAVQKLIENKNVIVNGAIPDKSSKLKLNDEVL